MEKTLLISSGAMLGANLRYWLSDWFSRTFQSRLPWGTLLINLSGSFILGLAIALVADRIGLDPRLKPFFVVGFLGSYTTFSTYTYEAVSLLMERQISAGLFTLIGSAVLGGVAVLAGMLLGKSL